MSSKEQIISNIRANTHERESRPSWEGYNPITFPDKLEQFISISKGVGGDAIVLAPGEDVNALIMQYYPDAKRIASCLPEITCATFNPDEVEKPGDLNGTDLAIIEGILGVCENGCVWIEQTMKHRAVCFISENLVILLPKDSLVHNMHEAYRQIQPSEQPYRGFISGPSKTADIEQALVVGAHGAKSTLVILH